jgi:hypothetical protein
LLRELTAAMLVAAGLRGIKRLRQSSSGGSLESS